jgi:hypothetical protein
MIPFSVSVDGLWLRRDDFTITYDTLRLKEAPPAGSKVYIEFYGGSFVFDANGSQNVFRFKYDISSYETMILIEKATTHKDNPAVADLLMQLRVVLELVNE